MFGVSQFNSVIFGDIGTMAGFIQQGPATAPATINYGSKSQRARELRGYNAQAASFAATTTAVVIANHPERIKLTIACLQNQTANWYILFGTTVAGTTTAMTASNTTFTVTLNPVATGAPLVYEDYFFSGPVQAVADTNAATSVLHVTEVW